MDKSFDPKAVESRWYQRWEEQGYFAPSGSGKPYTIALPPPNVTGRLHMGHAFQDTLMDALTRFHRMDGRNTLWQCGCDHAGIATQMVVERRLAAEGLHRRDMGRDAFVDAVWEWKEQSGGFITEQMRRLGASVDWETERFTMDEGLSAAVRKVFCDLYREGLIYRGKRLVNWDPVLHTALSDLEVVSEEEDGKLYEIRYPIVDSEESVTIATTRPETLLGDAAVAVNPKDDRFAHLVGKEVELPLCDRRIPVIADDYVDIEFGTGCLKITPAHDFNDYEVGRRHELAIINILTDDAAIGENGPAAYRGMDRFDARKQIVADLEKLGLLGEVHAHRHAIPRGDRSGAVLEPYLTDQWFVDLTRESLDDGRPGGLAAITRPAIDAVESGAIRFVPENWTKTYYEWMYNLQDWCISRQLWWGHRIPAWYDDQGNVYVDHSESAVRERYGLGDDVALKQDEDVLDTWFSSALWPFSTLGWPDKTERLETFYPTSVLVTGFDIIFFWVARMIMMGVKFMGEVPFHEVYIHGLVRDASGQKMSKSKGNILDPIDLVDGIDLDSLITKRTTGLMQPQMAPKIEAATRKDFPDGLRAFGADALRFTFAALATQGRGINFDIGRIEGYRNFCNKLWNAARFVLMNASEGELDANPTRRSTFDRWIISRLGATVEEARSQIQAYRFDLAAKALYEFTWHEYCDWYLELTKPIMYGDDEAAKAATRHVLLSVLEQLQRALHPLIPFITEEIWQQVAKPLGIEPTSVSVQAYPVSADAPQDAEAEADTQWFQAVLLGVRQIRGEMDIAPSKPLAVILEGGEASDRERVGRFNHLIRHLGRLDSLDWLDGDAPQSAVALAGELKLHVPLAGLIDKEEELKRQTRELEKRQGEIKRAQAKLANQKFVANAPEAVVQKERDKLSRAETELAEIEAQIERLKDI